MKKEGCKKEKKKEKPKKTKVYGDPVVKMYD
jgi:hypothetical protein